MALQEKLAAKAWIESNSTPMQIRIGGVFRCLGFSRVEIREVKELRETSIETSSRTEQAGQIRGELRKLRIDKYVDALNFLKVAHFPRSI